MLVATVKLFFSFSMSPLFTESLLGEEHRNGVGAVVNARPTTVDVRKQPDNWCFIRRQEAIGGES